MARALWLRAVAGRTERSEIAKGRSLCPNGSAGGRWQTFTDPESHAGTCYKAAGWTPLGLTAGHSRQRAEFYVPNERPKKLWVKALRPDARARLCAAELAPGHAAAETAGKGAPLPVTAGQLRPLVLALRAVPDPRRRNRFHPLAAMLCCVCVGLRLRSARLSASAPLRMTRFLEGSSRTKNHARVFGSSG